MMTARSRFLLASIAWVVFAFALVARAEPIDRVKDLYRSAAYEEALAVLDEMANDPTSTTSIEADEYRLLCLIALERRTEAHDAIAAMLNVDPFYQLSQVSPRVRTLFKDVRQSLLPAIVQRAYADAKAAFDRQDPQSGAQFERVLTLLNDPDIAAAATLADLRTVASAFRDLSKALTEERPEPPSVVKPHVVAADSTDNPAAPVLPTVYREGEPDLVAPEALNQTLPRWVLSPGLWGRNSREWQGILELVIGENGDVVSATLRKSFHPDYDAQLIKAAMGWKYKPALKSGTPVRFLKLVNVRLDAAN